MANNPPSAPERTLSPETVATFESACADHGVDPAAMLSTVTVLLQSLNTGRDSWETDLARRLLAAATLF